MDMQRKSDSKVAISNFYISRSCEDQLIMELLGRELPKDFGIIRVGQSIWAIQIRDQEYKKHDSHSSTRILKEMNDLIHHFVINKL